MDKNVIFCAGEQTVTMDDMEEFSKSLDLFKYYIKTNPEEAWVGRRTHPGSPGSPGSQSPQLAGEPEPCA